MEPSNDHERAIKVAVDNIAAEGGLSLISSIPEVAASLQFMMSKSDSEFLVRYMRWRMDEAKTMDSRTASILANPPYHSHVVYPYTDDRHLVDAVGFYTESGLGRNAAVILIATEAHRTAIKSYLKSDGHVEVLEASGQLSFFDAAETMNRFMANDNPDPRLFEAYFRPVIEHAQRDEPTGLKREAWFFGEMVDLLWPVNSAAAERLEELWNKMIKEYSIRILCAYSVGAPGRGPLSEALIKAHTHSIAQ